MDDYMPIEAETVNEMKKILQEGRPQHKPNQVQAHSVVNKDDANAAA